MPGNHRHSPPGLLQAIRRRASGRLRVAVLAIFAVGIAGQSMLGLLGGIHEATAPAHAAHGAVDHLAPHDHEAAVRDGTDADEGGPLHVLLHYTHCCSISVWMNGGDAVIAVFAPVRIESLDGSFLPLPVAHRTAPFRPPIAA